jgi:hypothetical protein
MKGLLIKITRFKNYKNKKNMFPSWTKYSMASNNTISLKSTLMIFLEINIKKSWKIFNNLLKVNCNGLKIMNKET